MLYISVLVVAAYFGLKFLHKIISLLWEQHRITSVVSTPDRSWFFGHYYALTNDQAGLYKRVELIEKYPSMYCYYMLGPLLTGIAVHHPDLVKVILNSDAHKGMILTKFVKLSFGNGLLSSEGVSWQKKRRMLSPAFHFGILKLYVNVFNETISSTLQWLQASAESGKACDVSLPCSRLSFDNMTQCIMSQAGFKDGKDIPLIHNLKEIQHLAMVRFSNPLLHLDAVFNLTSNSKKLKSLFIENDVTIDKVIQAHKKNLEKESNKIESKKRIDFMKILLQSKYDDGSGLSEKEIRDEVRLFFAAGSETTGNAMTWLAYELAQHQDWQDKCREEIIEVCGDKTDIELEDIARFENLHLCIKETLRLYPIGPLLGRIVHSPITLVDPYDDKKVVRLKSKSNLQISVFALHRHPEFWDNPNYFDPERFTPERSIGRHAYAYIPFGASRRNCIGQNFAMHEMKVTFAHILRKYKLLPALDHPVPILLPEITLQPKDHVYIRVEKVQ